MKAKTQRIAFIGVFSALAIILAFVEFILPPLWSAVPGIKMGLPNIIIFFLLYKSSLKEAVLVSVIRLFAVAFLFGNAVTLTYSFAGAFLSLTVMAIMKKINIFSMVGVSIGGAVCHNLAQVLVAMILLGTKEIGYYMIILAITGIIAGIFVGFSGILLLRYTDKFKV